MILVTGATGAFGKNAIEHLLNKGIEPSKIFALVRNIDKAQGLKEQGIQIKIGDYNDYSSLVEAFQGVDKLLFVSSSDVENRAAQHQNVVNAAKETDINHVIYTSFMRNSEVEKSAIGFLQDTHLKTENWLKESGINYTLLQNATYMDLLPMFLGEKVLESGVIMLPAKQGKSSLVLREELAEAAVVVLTTEGHENKVYPLVNHEALTYQEVAASVSAASGKTIKYNSPTPEVYQRTLKEFGVPEEYIGLFTAFAVAQANGELELYNNSLEQLLGRKPITTSQFLTTMYAS